MRQARQINGRACTVTSCKIKNNVVLLVIRILNHMGHQLMVGEPQPQPATRLCEIEA